MFRFVLAAIFSGLLSSPAAASACAELMDAFHVTQGQPPQILANTTLLDCGPADLSRFRINARALEAAVVPEDPADLYGTWLGDDVLLYLSGITVPGQEVLRIGPGREAGQIEIRQYWVKPILTASAGLGLDTEGRYDGLVASGTLVPQQDGYSAFVPPLQGLTYTGKTFEFSRADDLRVMAQINHFDETVILKLARIAQEEILVLHSAVRDVARNREPRQATYTKVAEGAPDLAITLLSLHAQSMALHFDCLTHQISEGKGPLFEAIAPVSLEALRTATMRAAQASQSSRQVLAELLAVKDRTKEQTDEARRQRLVAGDAMADPVVVAPQEAFGKGGICPAPF